MRLQLKKYPYRHAEHILNSKLAIKKEILSTLTDPSIDISSISRPYFNRVLKELFIGRGWEYKPSIFDEPGAPAATLDFLKERVGIEICSGHTTFIGNDLLKFQLASYSNLDKIDVGIYVVTTKAFQKRMKSEFGKKWEGSLTYDRVVKYLPYFKNEIQVPILVVGIHI